ncbi:hypothetical protein PHYSODRAFT_484496 [Phytophthora sojae]|uniref:HAT C-terminal dimerisation domain-containing protein n=1 Tax=Phytophthora sojae (strain P6497) TaxID=1094619 RepID=G4YUQ9_PHYSP|nr:hypothetical protein PHYSODRAFT_484496 [Phytophthora sojae]EGZ25984.1 hypothetical protein PHYSODRAFT_484496 [Phytophthora sojae]|eukprot:XP_009521272.1 hypothetical protein PHYSODRAFT_484496 [Phytophthora sojae]
MFDYELPSRRQISGCLLDVLYDREKTQLILRITESDVTNLALITDGSSNTNGDSIINFFESVIGSGKVTSVVTDNAANMKKAWRLVRKQRVGLVCTGYTTHGMNLLMKDIFNLDFFKDVLDRAKQLVRFFKDHRGLWSRFRDLQKALRKKGEKRRRLSLPVPTRWYTHEKCVANVFHNKDIIAAIFSDTALLKNYKGASLDEALVIFRDDDFWQKTAVVLKLIQPVNKCLAAFERDACSLSLVYHQFSWLCKHPVYTEPLDDCSVLLQAEVLGLINARRGKICTPTVKIAYLLDQTKTMYDPNDLEVKALINDAAQLAQDLQLVPTELAEKFHKQLQDFVLMKSAWTGKSREDNNAYSPIAWWSLETSNTYALVQEFAKLLLYIPTSSASSERSWSIHGFIHTKLRNRLTPERVNKLVFVYTNIARKSEVNHILYQLYPDAYDDSDISDESEDEEDENVASNHHRAAVTAITSECEEKEAGEVVQEAAAPAQNMFRTPPASQVRRAVTWETR